MLLSFTSCLWLPKSFAQLLTAETKLVSPDNPPSYDGFGFAVAISGDTAAIGAGLNNSSTGAVYVFVRDSSGLWSFQQKLLAGDAAAGDQFGLSVALDGDTLVIGAPVADTTDGADAGAAYIFFRTGSTWAQQAKLTASDGAPQDLFGGAVAISGDSVVVGAIQNDNLNGEDAGAVYVFVRSGVLWSEQQKLIASDGAANDRLGESVSISGDTAVAGAFTADTILGPDGGAAYVFERSGAFWTEQQKLLPSTASSHNFGSATTISGDTVAVGEPVQFQPTGQGSVFVFVRSGVLWTEQQQLNASDGTDHNLFGDSLSLEGDNLLVGAPGAGPRGGEAAAA